MLPGALPSWLTAEDAKFLSGGVVEADVLSALSLDGFISGKLQQSLENEVGNSIPAKAKALLWNAKLQRNAIALSNVLFRWDCLPTFYGSVLVAVPGDGRLLEVAHKDTAEAEHLSNSMAAAYEAFAGRHQNLRTFVYFGPDSLNVEGTPTAALMSKPLTYDKIAEPFFRLASSFTMIDGNVPYKEFRETWYKTDHHWSIEGAYRAYCKIAEKMGFGDEIVKPSGSVEFQTPPFYGSLSRRSLDSDYWDFIADYDIDFPDFDVTINGKKRSFESLAHHDLYEKNKKIVENRFANRYAEYFHNDYGLIEMDNPSAQSDRVLLIVGDSYSNCMERFMAVHYSKTYVLDPRHQDGSIDSFLEEHDDVDDVLFVMRSTNLLSDRTREALG